MEIQSGVAERGAAIPTKKIAALNYASGLMSATSFLMRVISMATGSTSPPEWRRWPAPAQSCLSDNAYQQDQRRGKITLEESAIWVSSSSENITQPVRGLWRQIRLDWAPRAWKSPGGYAKKAKRPSIAVLPFANMSGDPEQGIFRRRYFRGHHYGSVEIALVIRHRSQFVVYLQGQGRRREARLTRTGCALRPGGQAYAKVAIAYVSLHSSSTQRPAIISGPIVTTVNLLMSSRCRMRSPEKRSLR